MLISIFSLCVIAVLGWFGFTYGAKRRLGWSFSTTPVRTGALFLAFTLIAIALFPQTALALYGSPSLVSILFLVVVLAGVGPIAYLMAEGKGRSDAHQDLEFLKLDMRFLLSKPFDILFQQTVFGSLLLMLSVMVPLPYAIGLFVVLFGLFHVALFTRLSSAWALYFLFSAVILCFPLAYLLLFVESGVYYALAFHMLWYVLGGVLLREKEQG